MRLVGVVVLVLGLAARARAAPAFDAKDLAALDAAVPALVADKADCAKVGKHAVIVADRFGKIAAGKPATPAVITSDVPPRLLRHAIATQTALGPCLQTLDKQLVTRLALAMVRAPIAVRTRPAVARDVDTTDKPVPRPLPPDDQQLLGLCEFYLKVATPSDAERPSVLFMRANVLRRHDHLEKAIAHFLEIIDKHPKHEVAEFAANLALDSYNRLGKYDDLVALAKRLRDTPGFLDKRDDLRDVTNRILGQAQRRTAEQCERNAAATKNRDLYARCAEHYVALYNADPKSDHIDELLYNAAVLYTQAGSVGAALQMFALLKRSAPRSKLVPRALGRQGHLYSQIGMYAEAATALEEYAAKYAGEKDAYAALSDAFHYRRSLGDTAKAIADAQLFLRTFGTKKPADAAAMQRTLVAMAEDAKDDAALVRHATDFLRRHGGRDVNARVAVSVTLARSAWRRACPVAGIDGLCIEHVRARPAPTAAASCSPTAPKLRVVARKRAQADEAMRGFKAAIAIADRTKALDPVAQHAVLLARLAVADAQLEATFAGTAPADTRQLATWIADRQTQLQRALQSYTAMPKQVAPLARIGTGYQLFADLVRALDVPRDARTQPSRDGFCQQLDAAVAPARAQAIAAYETCLITASTANIVDGWSRSCARGLATLAPQKAPAPLVEPGLAPHVARIAVQVEPPLATTTPLFDELRRLEGKWTPAHCDRLGKQLLGAATQKGADRAAFSYMAGLAFHRCNKVADAERAYRAAGTHGRALSNLGALAAAAGKLADAKPLWTAALKADGKLRAARTNLAALQLDELRALSPQDAAWKRLADDIQFQLSSAMAIDEDDVASRVAFALLAFERSRPALGKLVLDSLAQATPMDPAVRNALAIHAWRTGQSAVAVDHWTASTDPSAPLNLALAALAIGKYTDARTRLAALKPASRDAYDHAVALGVAHRALGEHAAAEAALGKALQLDTKRPEAYFALGALHAQIATRATDRNAAIAAYKRAAEHHRKAADRATGALKTSALAAAADADRAQQP